VRKREIERLIRTEKRTELMENKTWVKVQKGKMKDRWGNYVAWMKRKKVRLREEKREERGRG